MSRLHLFTTTALSTILLTGMPALATDSNFVSEGELPAVSSPNGKIAAGGGGYDDIGFGFIEGSFSVPLNHSWGLQIDGIAGNSDNDGIFGGGGHLFWRNPHSGLLGIYGGILSVETESDDYTHHAVGLEAQAYMNQISLEGIVGHEGGDNVEDGLFAIGNIAVYPTDDVRLYGGVRYIQEDFLGAGGIEMQLSSLGLGSGFTVFGEGRLHDDDRWQAWGGVRIYFGQEKSLKRRHREDDPVNPAKEFLFDIDEVDLCPEPGIQTGNCEPTPTPEPIPD